MHRQCSTVTEQIIRICVERVTTSPGFTEGCATLAVHVRACARWGALIRRTKVRFDPCIRRQSRRPVLTPWRFRLHVDIYHKHLRPAFRPIARKGAWNCCFRCSCDRRRFVHATHTITKQEDLCHHQHEAANHADLLFAVAFPLRTHGHVPKARKHHNRLASRERGRQGEEN